MIWHDWLYAPLLNLLIFLYDAVGNGSLGLAVIALTVAIRGVLLPLSIVSERNALAYDRLQARIRAIEKENRADRVVMKERVRELLRAHKVSPWAKVIVLGIQLIVLVVLYQVFISGINASLDSLYPWIARPEAIDPTFFGYNLGMQSGRWAAAVGIFLAVEIAVSLKRRAHLDKSDLYYLFLYPRPGTGVVSVGQELDYKAWFAGVEHSLP